jgi:DNA-binding transcriptional regulator YiaG
MTPEEIRNFRKLHRLTQKELSKLVGVSTTTVLCWEKGYQNPSKPILILLDYVRKELTEGTITRLQKELEGGDNGKH